MFNSIYRCSRRIIGERFFIVIPGQLWQNLIKVKYYGWIWTNFLVGLKTSTPGEQCRRDGSIYTHWSCQYKCAPIRAPNQHPSQCPMYAAHCYHNQNHIVRVDGNLVPLDLMLKFYPFLHDRVKRSYIKNKVAFFKATPEISFLKAFEIYLPDFWSQFFEHLYQVVVLTVLMQNIPCMLLN